MHTASHPLAGRTVTLNLKSKDAPDIATGSEFRVEDYWDKITGGSWMTAQGNPAALKFAMRSGLAGLPLDDEVVYGKVGPYGHLVHVSELGEVV